MHKTHSQEHIFLSSIPQSQSKMPAGAGNSLESGFHGKVHFSLCVENLGAASRKQYIVSVYFIPLYLHIITR